MEKFFFTILIIISSIFSFGLGEGAYKSFYFNHKKETLIKYKNALEHAKKTADLKKEIIYKNNIATIYNLLGKKDSAEYYLNSAKKSCSHIGCLNALVDINYAFLKNDFSKEITDDFFNKNCPYSFNKFEKSNIYIALGNYYVQKNLLDKAEEYIKKSYKLLKKSPTKSLTFANAIFNLALIYNKNKEYKKSNKFADKSIKIFRKYVSTYGIKKCLELKKDNYSNIPDLEKKKNTQRLILQMEKTISKESF